MWGGRDPFDDPFFTGRPERSRDRGDRRDDDRRLERRDPFALVSVLPTEFTVVHPKRSYVLRTASKEEWRSDGALGALVALS